MVRVFIRYPAVPGNQGAGDRGPCCSAFLLRKKEFEKDAYLYRTGDITDVWGL